MAPGGQYQQVETKTKKTSYLVVFYNIGLIKDRLLKVTNRENLFTRSPKPDSLGIILNLEKRTFYA